MRIVGCFLEYESKFVILLRHSHKPNGDTWGLPAGKVEQNESDKSAILRELREETGYNAYDSQLEHLGDYEFGKDAKYIFATFRVNLTEPYELVVEGSAHAEYKWVSADECYALPNLIPDFQELLKLVGFVK
jgi:8-oxo-dGTP pyrophosphatase MutT (NUDIX family)